MKPFLLMIGDDGTLLVPPCLKESAPPLFAAHHDEDKALLLLETLAKHPRVPVLIVADTLAQEFHRDTLPQLSFLDKHKLMQRRLSQRFPDPSPQQAQLSTAFASKNNQALYVCLHTEGPVARWMTRLEAQRNPFHGVVSLPLVGVGLLAKLMPEAHKGWCLLLSWQQTGGFRQIVTHDGAFVFTRLTPPLQTAASSSFITASLTLDLQATLDYLSRLGLSGNTPLRMAAILPETLHKAIRTLPAPLQVGVVLTPHQAAQKLGLAFSALPDDPTSDLLYAGWVFKQRFLRPVLLPADQRQAFVTARVKKAGFGVAAFIGLIALSCLGWQSHGLWQMAKANRLAAQHLAVLQQIWEQERAKLAPVTEPLGRLRQAVARQRLFAEPSLTPWPLLQSIDQVIGTAGRLTHLNWQCGKNGSVNESLRFTLRLTESTPSLPDDSAPRQDVVRLVDQLAQDLREALPDYSVTVTRYPFLIKPDETLTNVGDKPNASIYPTAAFDVRKGSS